MVGGLHTIELALWISATPLALVHRHAVRERDVMLKSVPCRCCIYADLAVRSLVVSVILSSNFPLVSTKLYLTFVLERSPAFNSEQAESGKKLAVLLIQYIGGSVLCHLTNAASQVPDVSEE